MKSCCIDFNLPTNSEYSFSRFKIVLLTNIAITLMYDSFLNSTIIIEYNITDDT